MTKYQLKDKKSQESLVDGRGMWHRLDKQLTQVPHIILKIIPQQKCLSWTRRSWFRFLTTMGGSVLVPSMEAASSEGTGEG